MSCPCNEERPLGEKQGEYPCSPEGEALVHLNPPISVSEKMRDRLLRVLDGVVFQAIGLFVLFLVIADGAFFFFLLMGWHTMCAPKTDCDPRNFWYNVAVQVLTGLFTYTALVSMPWRCVNAIHVFGCHRPFRINSIGHDLYGLPSNDVWFHIPLGRRKWIAVLLLLNCLTQFANQVTRIQYSSFEAQNTYPGNIWTGVFFLTSMLCAAIAGAWLAREDSKLRKASPEGRFPPGFLQVIGEYCRSCCRKRTDAQPENEELGDDGMQEDTVQVSETFDPTRNVAHCDVMAVDRGAMRLFAM